MMVPKPHFLLFCDGQSPKVSKAKEAAGVGAVSATVRGRWRFVLEDLDAGTRLEAGDAELVQAPERAALLAVVRGLEALEQPSRVTLVTTSRYVSRGLQFGLSEWRESDYCWEHFGSVQPIRNADLWRRIDHALQFHQINCQWIASPTSDDGEEMTQLQIEPILATHSSTAMADSTETPNLEQGLCKTALIRREGSGDTTVQVDEVSSSSRGCLIGRFFGAPLRSLRLPNLSSFFTSVDRHGWTGKLTTSLTWLSKSARATSQVIT